MTHEPQCLCDQCLQVRLNAAEARCGEWADKCKSERNARLHLECFLRRLGWTEVQVERVATGQDIESDQTEPGALLLREIGEARLRHVELYGRHEKVLANGGDWVRSGDDSSRAEKEMLALLDRAAELAKGSR